MTGSLERASLIFSSCMAPSGVGFAIFYHSEGLNQYPTALQAGFLPF